MINHFLVKTLLIFAAGALFAVLAIEIFAGPGLLSIVAKNPKGVETQVKGEIAKKERSTADKIIKKVLPAIAESPIFSPVREAKEDVEETVDTIRSLPDDQKSAICKQICAP